MSKIYKIEKTRRNNRKNIVEGTVEELTEYFGYTLLCGNSWNKKINKTPRGIKSLITNINNSYNEKREYDNYVELV